MNTVTIYEKYGGFEFFHKIIYELYLELFDHLEISYHFIGVDIERLSLRQTEFLCEAIGGPKMYKGQEITIVHKFMRVTEYEFETVAKRFAEIFKYNGLSDEEVIFIMTFIGSKKAVIVTSRNTPFDKLMRELYIFIKKIKLKIKFLFKFLSKFN